MRSNSRVSTDGCVRHAGLLTDSRPDRNQFSLRDWLHLASLLSAEEVEIRNLMNAGHGAERSARLLRNVLAANVLDRVVFERLGWEPALLRATVHQSVLADVQITRAGAATPIGRLAVRNILLKVVETGEMLLLEALHLEKDFPFPLPERL